jgi:hypothetical protein
LLAAEKCSHEAEIKRLKEMLGIASEAQRVYEEGAQDACSRNASKDDVDRLQGDLDRLHVENQKLRAGKNSRRSANDDFM